MEKMSVFRAKFSLKKPGNTPFAAYDGNLSFNISLRERNIGMYLPAALIIAEKISGRSQRGGGAGGRVILTNQPQKQGKLGKMGRKREHLEENVKLAGSLPLRTGRAGYGPGISSLNLTSKQMKYRNFVWVV